MDFILKTFVRKISETGCTKQIDRMSQGKLGKVFYYSFGFKFCHDKKPFENKYN